MPAATTAHAFGGQKINPFAGRDGLAGHKIGAKRCPVPFALVVLVWDGSFHHQNERPFGNPVGSLTKWAYKLVAIFICKERIVKPDFGSPGQGACDQIFYAGLSGASHGNGVAIAAQGPQSSTGCRFLRFSRSSQDLRSEGPQYRPCTHSQARGVRLRILADFAGRRLPKAIGY